MRKKLHEHYHWVIALVVLLELLIWGGVGNNLNSLYVLPVTQEFQVSRGSFSLVMSLNSLTGFLSTMLSGILLLRFGYRRLVSCGLLVTGLSFCFLLGSSHSLVTIGLGVAIYGFCGGVCSTAGVARIVGDWFHRQRGLVLGLISAATGIGGSVFCLILTAIMQGRGWRASYVFSGVMLLMMAAAMALLVRSRPDDMKLRPYGEGQLPAKKRHRGGHSEESWAGFSLKELARKPTFFLMMGLTLLSCLSLYLGFYVVVPHMRDCGLTAEQAATVQSVMLLGLSVAKLLSGALSDRIGPRWVTVLCMAFGAVGLWLMAQVQTMTGALIAICIYTMSLPLTTITVPLLTTELFGYRAHDTAVGLFLAMVHVGGMIASPLINLIYDAIGSYSPAMRAGAVLAVAVIVLYEVLYALAQRDKRAWKAARAAKTGAA